MKKNLWLLACPIASMVFVSCNDDNDDPYVPPIPGVDQTMMYFINEGSWSVPNSASFCYYNTTTKASYLMEDPTSKIGDTPQDMIIVGANVYVTCWGSKGLLKVNLASTAPSQFVSLNEEVRYMAYKAPYIYISCYGGKILRYNPANGNVSTLQTSGSNLEGVAIVGDKLYACNSYSVDGSYNYIYHNNLVTVDLTTFTEAEPVTTVTNPNYIVALDGALYVLGLAAVCSVDYVVFSVSTLWLVGYLLFPVYAAYALWRFFRYSRTPYACGSCGWPLREKGHCPHCGTMNE